MVGPNADDTYRLRLFQRRVQDLRECGVVRQGEITLKVSYPLGSQPDMDSVPFEGFDRDQFRSAIQTLRQFTLKNDAVSFFSICNLIWRVCNRQELKDWTAYARRFWNDTMASSPLSFRVGEKKYDVESALELMLDGFLAHTDIAMSREWDSLSPGGKATIYFIVQRSLFDLFYCLNLVDSVILYWLDKPEVVVLKLGLPEVTADSEIAADGE